MRLYLPFLIALNINFERTVIIHDGTIFQKYVDFSIFDNVKYLWHFDTKLYDDHNLIHQQLSCLKNNDGLFNVFKNKMFTGCLGSSLAITKKFLLEIEEKYCISKLSTVIHSKEHAVAFERTISIICFELYPKLINDLSFEGEISNMIWGLKNENFKENKEKIKNKSIIKLFGAR